MPLISSQLTLGRKIKAAIRPYSAQHCVHPVLPAAWLMLATGESHLVSSMFVCVCLLKSGRFQEELSVKKLNLGKCKGLCRPFISLICLIFLQAHKSVSSRNIDILCMLFHFLSYNVINTLDTNTMITFGKCFETGICDFKWALTGKNEKVSHYCHSFKISEP